MRSKNIRNAPSTSAYFGGGFRRYGLHQWCIKFHAGFESNHEQEDALLWAFGEYSHKTNSFDQLNDMLGRTIKASTAGRSGGWLVIDSELTEDEVEKIDAHVKSCLEGLPSFLREERQFRADEAKASQDAEEETRAALKRDERVEQALDLIREVAGCDFVLMIKGIRQGEGK